MAQLELQFDSLAAEVAETPTGIKPRDYQRRAIERTFELFVEGAKGALIRQPTGTGKTVVGSLIAGRWLEQGPEYRVIVLAHEQQLVWQFAEEINDILGITPGVEMASDVVPANRIPQITVASRATLLARKTKDQEGTEWDTSRLYKFDAMRFKWLVLVDEAHRYAMKLKSCRHIFDWFSQNPESRRLGLTATPMRGDGVTLAKVFPAVAEDYPLFSIEGGPCAVKDGYAVPYDQRFVRVEGVDFRRIKETNGDFDEKQLAAELTTTKALASMVQPMLDLVGKRRTIVFCVTVAMAKDVASYINALGAQMEAEGAPPDTTPGEAKQLDGTVPHDAREQVYAAHQAGKFQFLCVCGLCREGYNDPGIGAVAVFRPTKSRSLAEQMKGRGCRPLRRLVDGLATAEERRAAIAASAKPSCLIVDLVGVTGMADCASTAHILASGKPDEVIERANQNATKKAAENPDQSIDMAEEVRKAEQEIKDEEERKARARREKEEREAARLAREAKEREERRQADRRARLGAEVAYTAEEVQQGHGGKAARTKSKGPTMPFGKHKGKPMAEVPTGYLRCVTEGDWCKTPWIRQVCKAELDRRRGVKPQPQAGPVLMPFGSHKGEPVTALPDGLLRSLSHVIIEGDHAATERIRRAASAEIQARQQAVPV